MLVLSLGAWALSFTAAGCFSTTTCTSLCLDQYDDCIDRAPPGASKSDCSAQYQTCMQRCASAQPDSVDEAER
jgi:hypothetical protein